MISPVYESFVNDICMEARNANDSLIYKGICKLNKLADPNWKSEEEKDAERKRKVQEDHDRFINTPEYKEANDYYEKHKNQLTKSAMNLALKEIKKDDEYDNIKISDLEIIDNGYSKFGGNGNYIRIYWIYPSSNSELCYGVIFDFSTHKFTIFDSHDKYYNHMI